MQVKKTLFSVVTIISVIIIVALILTSCRAKRSVSTTQHQQSASTSAAETHKADSLWASLLEQTYIKIEYHNESFNLDSTVPASVTLQGSAVVLPPQGNIKSIEIIHKQEMQMAQTTKIDSVAVADTFTENSETIEKETAAGHDYGFLVFLAVGAALVLIGFCYIKLR